MEDRSLHPPQCENGLPSFFQDSALPSKLSDSVDGSFSNSSYCSVEEKENK